jgi:prespore-specific regulator
MSAVRQDAWTPDDDLILAEVTLRHIREGSTQLAAFEEVGERIGRTAAACGFRWNSCVRKKYEAAIQIAKEQRQKRNQLKRRAAPETAAISFNSEELQGRQEMISEDSLSIDTVIRFLRQLKGNYQEMHKQIKNLQRELKEREEKVEQLLQENENLKKEVNEVQTDYRVVNDDYKALIQIMDRARKLALLVEEENDELKPKFKMDANGNLERVE